MQYPPSIADASSRADVPANISECRWYRRSSPSVGGNPRSLRFGGRFVTRGRVGGYGVAACSADVYGASQRCDSAVPTPRSAVSTPSSADSTPDSADRGTGGTLAMSGSGGLMTSGAVVMSGCSDAVSGRGVSRTGRAVAVTIPMTGGCRTLDWRCRRGVWRRCRDV